MPASPQASTSNSPMATTTVADPASPSPEATATSSVTATSPAPETAIPSATPPAAPPSTVPTGPAAVECTPANIDIQRQDTVRAIKPIPANEQQYYTVLGCAEGWLAYAISDEGVKAIGLDGGNAWYNVATLQDNGRYLTDFGQLWTSVYNWEFQTFAVQNGKYATAQEAMDHDFATKGIPVRLRETLVGPGPVTNAP